MKKGKNNRLMARSAAAFLVFALAVGLTGCGGSKEEEQQVAVEETAEVTVEESADEATTIKEQKETEEIKPEEAPQEVTAETGKTEEKEEEPKEAEVIQKPEPTEEVDAAEEEAEEKKKKKEKEESSSSNGLELLDGKMTFDGMELEFPIELSSMSLGNWKIEYQDVDDPEGKTLAPSEIVTAVMTSSSYTEDDVTVIAEFGNYSNETAALTDLPMTGIYLTKGKGKDGKEPALPEVVMPGNLTWGSTEAEVRELFGEASLSGTFDKDFDYMYENGSYMVEFGGMNDTGLDYIVYCVE